MAQSEAAEVPRGRAGVLQAVAPLGPHEYDPLTRALRVARHPPKGEGPDLLRSPLWAYLSSGFRFAITFPPWRLRSPVPASIQPGGGIYGGRVPVPRRPRCDQGLHR